ncbi:MAG: hypothetical protein KKA65_01340 [Nanoarchaeota archaeon]|nr:hypothetical protein [Nanoarchaeota archaeon]MBU4241643.1 hypothetical protein [Nanoarchaeota archaeon]MBU4351929.1 hypothetical protein [Nanoarchaeota archaeon]MBU4456121.1 hypothetical protein [Nanoarchaeota archaeon]MCG2720273.1 hypothetical protein [Nanoarchaeota archaeon]
MQILEEEALEIFNEIKENLKISYTCKDLKLKKRKVFLLVEKLQKIEIEEDWLLKPKIMAYGQLVDKDNNPLFSKEWYKLSKKNLVELCDACYELD